VTDNGNGNEVLFKFLQRVLVASPHYSTRRVNHKFVFNPRSFACASPNTFFLLDLARVQLLPAVVENSGLIESESRNKPTAEPPKLTIQKRVPTVAGFYEIEQIVDFH
jgi:hypothetical protein